MKKPYQTPTLDVVLLEDKESISMQKVNTKTFIPTSLTDSCGYNELAQRFPNLVAGADPAMLEMFINDLSGFTIRPS